MSGRGRAPCSKHSPSSFSQQPPSADLSNLTTSSRPSPATQWSTVGLLPNGRVRAHNATLRMLLAAAYDIDADRVTGGPAWLDSDSTAIRPQLRAFGQSKGIWYGAATETCPHPDRKSTRLNSSH